MAWYKDKVNQNIDVTQAVRDAGKLGEAIAYAAQGVKGYADTLYNKKRAKIGDSQKAADLAMRKYTADKGYAGKVDSARINAASSDRSNAAMLKAHNIDFNKERYKTDGAYKKAIDAKLLEIKKQKIATQGNVKVANINAGSKRYVADVGNMNSRINAAAKLKAAKINAQKAATKAQAKARVKLNDDMSAADVVKALRKKKGQKVDDFEVEMQWRS